MAATARKFEARDLCLVYSENDPRVSSRRVAEEVQPRKRGPRTDNINDFIERNRAELERYGPIPCAKVMVHRSQGGGRHAFEYLLNEDQVTIILMRLDTPEAADARFEIVQLIRAYRRGEILQSEITIIADLFTPQRPTIERGIDNIVHVKHAQGESLLRDSQPNLFESENHPPSAWSAAYDEWVKAFCETSLPRPTGRTAPDLEDADDTIARRIWLDPVEPYGFGDGSMEAPTMFMRDELPLNHSADSWRVWISGNWFRLPLNLRRRWWRDTDYGKREPSPEMIKAIIAIALP